MLRKFLQPQFDAERSALIVRCYAEQEDDNWVAVCLEFCLAVQGESLDEVRQKLHAQIDEYVHDAVLGEDQQHVAALMTRHAPLSSYARYYRIKWSLHIINQLRNGIAKTFKENVRYVPSHHCPA